MSANLDSNRTATIKGLCTKLRDLFSDVEKIIQNGGPDVPETLKIMEEGGWSILAALEEHNLPEEHVKQHKKILQERARKRNADASQMLAKFGKACVGKVGEMKVLTQTADGIEMQDAGSPWSKELGGASR